MSQEKKKGGFREGCEAFRSGISAAVQASSQHSRLHRNRAGASWKTDHDRFAVSLPALPHDASALPSENAATADWAGARHYGARHSWLRCHWLR